MGLFRLNEADNVRGVTPGVSTSPFMKKKSAMGYNNSPDIGNIIPELYQENLIRGRGLFCRALMKAQLTSPGFTHVYAALVAIVNTKLPEVGLLLLRRVVFQFRRAFKRNDKVFCF